MVHALAPRRMAPGSRAGLRWGCVVTNIALGGCLIEFPRYAGRIDSKEDAAASDDVAAIEPDRFDWGADFFGLVVDGEGRLHALSAAAVPQGAGLAFAHLRLDDAWVEPEATTVFRVFALGAGQFRLELPAVGAWTDISAVVSRDADAGVASMALSVGGQPWDGPIVGLRRESSASSGAEPLGFLAVGETGGVASAWAGLGTLDRTPPAWLPAGDCELAVSAGLDSGARAVAPFSAALEWTTPYGGFRARDAGGELLLAGESSRPAGLLVAHRWSTFSEPPPGGPVALRPVLWLGVHAGGEDIAALSGRWGLRGVVGVANGAWRGEAMTLAVTEEHTFSLLDAAGATRAQGDVERLQGEAHLPAGVLSLHADSGSEQGTWQMLATGTFPYVVLWRVNGRAPQPAVYFGVRER